MRLHNFGMSLIALAKANQSSCDDFNNDEKCSLIPIFWGSTIAACFSITLSSWNAVFCSTENCFLAIYASDLYSCCSCIIFCQYQGPYSFLKTQIDEYYSLISFRNKVLFIILFSILLLINFIPLLHELFNGYVKCDTDSESSKNWASIFLDQIISGQPAYTVKLAEKMAATELETVGGWLFRAMKSLALVWLMSPLRMTSQCL